MQRQRFLPGLVASLLIAMLLTVASSAQSSAPATEPAGVTFATLLDFGGVDGQYPNGPLEQGLDGSFYGTPYLNSGGYGVGFAYAMSAQGAWTGFNFNCDTPGCIGIEPFGGLLLAGDGNFYGGTILGGTGKYKTNKRGGTIFRLNPQTGLTTIYSFCEHAVCRNGESPGGMTLGADGNLYGTASGGQYGLGMAFMMTTGGTLTTLHNFHGADGSYPGTLMQGSDGNLYGTTSLGGTGGNCGGCEGTVFRMTPQGALTTLHSFCRQVNCTDGIEPSGLIQAADGNFYGTTFYGAPSNGMVDQTGTAFKLTANGTFTTLYHFCSLAPLCADGGSPVGLVQASDGNFYGETAFGGAYGRGTIFRLTPAGEWTKLYDFCALGGVTCPDGFYPGSLVQGTDGNFYGTVPSGGIQDFGIAFQLSLGLEPFVRTVTSAGAPGASVIILGTNLTGATSVTFNGMSAAYTVESSSEITATVPAGASTGPVVVATPGVTLKSIQNFRILP